MYWPPVAEVVRVSTVCKLFDCPWRKIIVTGLEVSFVAYVIACASPSVTGSGTWVKVSTELWAAASAARPLMRKAWVNISVVVSLPRISRKFTKVSLSSRARGTAIRD